MPTLFTVNDLTFEGKENAPESFDIQTAIPRLSKAAGSNQLVFDIRSLHPDKYSFPYHFHHNSEELMVIFSGAMMLRTPEGFRELNTGDVVFFETGEAGAHQFYNHTNIPCTYLDIRTANGTDVCEYPDSGKIGLLPHLKVFKKGEPTDYFAGEENVDEKWKEIK